MGLTLRIAVCFIVRGWEYICVFIAGQNTRGLETSQARTMQVSRLSQSPCAILAMVLASRGAITRTCAHSRSWMWSTESPRPCHADHSSSSSTKFRSGYNDLKALLSRSVGLRTLAGVLEPQWLQISLMVAFTSVLSLLFSPFPMLLATGLNALAPPALSGRWVATGSTLDWHRRKWQARSVGTIMTLAPRSLSRRASSGTLMVATLPVHPRMMRGPPRGAGSQDILGTALEIISRTGIMYNKTKKYVKHKLKIKHLKS